MCVLYSACTGSPPFCSAINTVITVAIRVLLSPLWCPTYSLTVPHRVPAMTLRAPTHFLFLSRLRISTHAKLGWGQGVVQNAKLTVTLRIAFVIILPCSNTSSLCTNHCSEKVWPTYLFEYSHIRPSVSDTCPLTVQSSRCKFGSTSSWKKKKKEKKKKCLSKWFWQLTVKKEMPLFFQRPPPSSRSSSTWLFSEAVPGSNQPCLLPLLAINLWCTCLQCSPDSFYICPPSVMTGSVSFSHISMSSLLEPDTWQLINT